MDALFSAVIFVLLDDIGLQYAEGLINSVELGHWMDKLPPIKAANLPCGM